MMWLWCPDDTAFAPGFRESSFENIGFGSTDEEVLRFMGAPLTAEELPGGGKLFAYAGPGNHYTCHFVRNIAFDKRGAVTTIFSSFYWD
jgi:hypothetical protein